MAGGCRKVMRWKRWRRNWATACKMHCLWRWHERRRNAVDGGERRIMGSAHQRLKDLHPELEVIVLTPRTQCRIICVSSIYRNRLYLVSCQPDTSLQWILVNQKFSIVALLIITTILWAFSFSFMASTLRGTSIAILRCWCALPGGTRFSAVSAYPWQ